MVLAKSVAIVDRLSGGRLTMAVGTGYLRSEFAAVGRSFDDRIDSFDEAIQVLRGVFVGDTFAFEGSDFRALGVVNDPPPVQLPHPPIWVGGSSQASLRRVARFGNGWTPLLDSMGLAKTVRTASMRTIEDVGRMIEQLGVMLHDQGRDLEAVAVQLDGLARMDEPADLTLERLTLARAVGVTHVVVRPPAGEVAQVAEALQSFGRSVIDAS
jgi:alkanesulfonate monooxygenase SsuD/methylene tetrahydromethanopterin reductase-like flavin-dependent oxidoreductase (luciferase family)